METRPPSLTNAVVEPNPIVESSELSCLPEGWFDPDGDDLNVSITWLVNGIDASEEELLNGTSFSRSDSVSCTLLPSDAHSEGEPVVSESVTVANSPPVMTSVIAGPMTASVEDEARATVEDEDPDDDTITFTYAWSSGSTTLGTDATQSLDSLARGDTVVVVVSPSDGTDTGAGMTSAALVVANAAPKVTGFRVSPAKPTATDTVTAVATDSDSDSDGDKVTGRLEWSVNGTVVSTASSVTGGTDFKVGDVITVEVVPDDGLDTGVPAAVTVAILGSKPTRPIAVFEPRHPEVGDSIQCALDLPSVNPDGKGVTYFVSWENRTDRWHTYKTSTTTHTGDTIDKGYVVGGHEWRCYLYAFDGTDYSPGDYAYAYVTAAGSERIELADGVAWGSNAQSLALVGDVNSDKTIDVAVGDWRTDSEGEVNIVSGDLSGVNEFDDEVLYTLTGHAGHDRAGKALLGGLDLDADGDDDLIVSAEMGEVDSMEIGQGVVYLIPAPFKSGDVHSLAKVRLSGKSSWSGIGNTLRTSDFDGDSKWELVTASEVEDVGTNVDAGEIDITESPITADMSMAKADTTIRGDASDARCGIFWDVGDHNGDGDSDILSYAFLKFTNGSDSGLGQLHLFEGSLPSGNIDLTADSDAVIYLENGAVWGGAHINFSDYDDDGYDDFLLGVGNTKGIGGTSSGRLYLVLGSITKSSSSLSSADMTVDGAYRFMGFGNAEFADIDGSGVADLVVRNNGRYLKGNIHIFYDLGSSGSHDSDDADVVLNGGQSLLLSDMDVDGQTDIWTSLLIDDLREDRDPGVGVLGLYLGSSL